MTRIAKFFRRPPRYVTASLLCSFGGFLQGIDTSIIGPVTVMERYVRHFGNPSPAVHGLVVSSILLSAAVTSFLAGHVADSLGRSPGIALGAVIFAVGVALEAGAAHLAMFITGRLIVGVGEGFINGIMLAQLFVCFGLLAGFFTCYGTARIETDWCWRLPFVLLAIYAVAFSAAAFFLLPPSPRWLADQGRSKPEIAAAWAALEIQDTDQDDAPSDDPAAADAPIAGAKRGFNVMAVLAPEARARFFMAVFLMAMQQLCGIDGVLYYAPLLFQQAGIAVDGDTFLVSGVLAIVIVAVTIPGTIWADSWGRRPNTILGGLGMAVCMLLLGALYASNVVTPTGAARWIVVITIYVFTVLYCISWGIVLKIYAAEIQPQRTRATATSIAHGANWLTNFLVALITPILLANSKSGAYFLFASCTLVTAVVCWFGMPETRRRTLTEIQQDFQSSYAKKLLVRRSNKAAS